MDLIDTPEPGQNAPEFSVSEISGAIKRMIEGEFSHVRIRAEVGRVSRPRSGHVYLDLKDDRAVLAGVMWKGVAARQTTQPEEGMEVVAVGRLTTFPGQSKYQMVIEEIRPAGMGALMAMLEKRKAQLTAEGLFDPTRKKALPYLPDVIGVVTSPSGAVIRDILHRLRDRFPRKVLIWPVAVQGERCAPEVARAIAGFNAMSPGGALPRPDLLIVARGGGSVEDLWGFNEETVVRAAASSDIPLISAVGHETDTTLIDYAADQRAPTPTAAAELAVPVRLELLAWVEGQGARLSRGTATAVQRRRQRLSDLSRALPKPGALLDGARQRLDLASDRLPAALDRSVQRRKLRLTERAGSLRPQTLGRMVRAERERVGRTASRLIPALVRTVATKRDTFRQQSRLVQPQRLRADLEGQVQDLTGLSRRLSQAGSGQIARWQARVEAAGRMHETLSYKATLERGYAVVRAEGAVVTRKAQARSGAVLEIEFADGRLTVGGKSAPRAKPKPPEQGSLF
ncbi:exodeoxyribonuclease VII large subunit [Aestuariivita sp.]|jgi:exodeoxyribonuclease VII large subunit|uniref:exodeoxyribonuclease VII large subunit n=1 Tax=Aestuariivita sp. TaxID=1872407 RepID=UPI00216C58F0|nr:exodeoxyribonuclease VII large subunit [Aestuariivita sp.]MCE8007924.1 exodeoxyribonuclease VII large subunit [Aestuariivita sp.]